ncbi:MAG: hypothetical protein H0X30_02935 [Anaerolineae bacterium]|nr:hypothetical protein [Anaerolineae bacterium]
MELMLFFRVLLRRWWLVVIPVLIVAVVVIPQWLRERSTSGGGYTVTLRYTAAQSASNVAPRDGDYQDVWLASELAVNALTDWVRSTSFEDEIGKKITDLNAAGFGVAADNKRSVGQLIMSYPDEKGLAAITQAAMDVMKTQAQNYFPQLGGQAAQVTFLDSPVITAAPPPIANRFAPFIRLALGLLGGMALAFLWEYLDPFVYRREQVEAAGLPVLASIPKK